jgi:hypothetical protein
VSYEVEFRTPAAQQTRPLDETEYLSLNAALRAAAQDPFDPSYSEPTPDVHVRRVDFGVHVVGLATVTIDVPAKKMRVTDVRWVGYP